ncbi:Hypothetical predicted protein [Octopus vulgaris]|uniref:Uncharacterized protein n=1 Tax=Octopus vulgaris TaxID=6645 RepID=A0AA36EXZ6_OCTVU|nr:Hypothetical predicted protein [Octopus vulgaris]
MASSVNVRRLIKAAILRLQKHITTPIPIISATEKQDCVRQAIKQFILNIQRTIELIEKQQEKLEEVVEKFEQKGEVDRTAEEERQLTEFFEGDYGYTKIHLDALVLLTRLTRSLSGKIISRQMPSSNDYANRRQ